jgi:hypothetical protein
MTDTPPDWVLIEAAKRSGWKDEDELLLRHAYLDEVNDAGFTALCDMIQKYEQPPVDRKLLCAREAMMGQFVNGVADIERICVRAIELWEEGFGK